MQVHPPHREPHVPAQELRRAADNSAENKVSSARDSVDSATGSEAPHYTAAPEVLKLAARLRALPDVRAQRVEEVAQRLAAGEYLSTDAAERTAATILKS